jgi:23S rRNA pseudouridine2605 synthase
MTDEHRPDAQEAELNETPEIETPEIEIEDVIAAEAVTGAPDAADADTEAEDDAETDAEAGAEEDEDEPEFTPQARPPAKLERLQKILAQAGVASRRKAEEMIEQGRVQVNGKVVTELGTKADAGRDHIRVDGKLLQGAERLRYFVLNKPRGFVTTVKDPEGRPTVMQFFDKMRERLYPVGRLDYLSEGLLLVTNDGELANKLTKASAGVEKTYLVKVAGIPTEGELDILRAGVAIEKGKPGSAKVRTSPARIRQVRQGDNPWYEVVLIEGRNRELRKMFEEIGHFVEKIRRVGYGPLILDQEPGNLRELDAHELELLRKAADGKLRTPKAKEIRRRNIVDSLPPEKPASKPRGDRPAAGPKDYKPKKAFGADAPGRGRTAAGKFGAGPAKFGSSPAKFGAGRPADRPASGPAERPAWKKDDRPAAPRTFGGKPAAGRSFADRPAGRSSSSRPEGGKPYEVKPSAGRGFPPKPAWKKPEATQWPPYKRPPADRPEAGRHEATRRPAPEPIEDLGPKKPSRLHIEPVHETERPERTRSDRPRTDYPRPDYPRAARPSSGRPSSNRPSSDRPGSDRSGSGQSSSGRPPSGRPAFGRSGPERSSGGRSSSGSRSSSPRPFRSEGGLARPFTTSSGKPRAGGARPSSKPGKDGGRSYGPGAGRSSGRGSGPAKSGPAKFDSAKSGSAKRPFRRDEGAAGSRPSRPFTPRAEGAEGFRPRSEDSRPERRTGSGWKPKPSFGGKSKPGGGKPSGSGAKRSGPRPGGKRPGGKRP